MCFAIAEQKVGQIANNTRYFRKDLSPYKLALYIFEMKKVLTSEIKNSTELRILKLLKVKGACLYGDIFKELSLSSSEGQQIIFSLLSRGLIRYQNRSSHLELNIELK